MYTSFTQMPVWDQAMKLSSEIYNLSIRLPKSEDYGLTSQIRRAANSVSANIAEGFGRSTAKDKAHFYIVAKGSAYETQNHLIYGNRVGYFDINEVEPLLSQYSELIKGLNKINKSLL